MCVCVFFLQKGQGVDVDGELTTLLSTSYLRENFDFADTNVKPVTKRVSRALLSVEPYLYETKFINMVRTAVVLTK